MSHSVRCLSKKVIESITAFMVMIKSKRMLFIQWIRGAEEVTSMIIAHQKTSEY